MGRLLCLILRLIMFEGAVCRVCSCTDGRACPGECYWVREDVCSRCATAVALIACSQRKSSDYRPQTPEELYRGSCFMRSLRTPAAPCSCQTRVFSSCLHSMVWCRFRSRYGRMSWRCLRCPWQTGKCGAFVWQTSSSQRCRAWWTCA